MRQKVTLYQSICGHNDTIHRKTQGRCPKFEQIARKKLQEVAPPIPGPLLPPRGPFVDLALAGGVARRLQVDVE